MNEYRFDIELKPSSDELRPTKNIPTDAPNRQTITEETHRHTTLQTTLRQVQFGTYNEKPTCLLVLAFRFKFRPGIHRVKSVKVHIDFSSPSTSIPAGAPTGGTSQSISVVNIEPKVLLGAPVYEAVNTTKSAGVDAGNENVGLHFSLERGSNYTRKRQIKIEGIVIGEEDTPDSQVEWDIAEAAKVKGGVVPTFRAAILLQYTGPKIYANFKMDAEEGWLARDFWDTVNVFGKKGFDLNDPLILDPMVPFGPQIQKPLSDIDLTELIKLDPLPVLSEDYS